MAVEIDSVFTRPARSICSRLFKEYNNDPNLDFRKFLKDQISKTIPDGFEYYLSDEVSELWLSTVPSKLGQVEMNDTIRDYTSGELRKFADDKLVYFICYLFSVFGIDKHFRETDILKAWLPLYVGDKHVMALEKIIHVMPFEKFLKVTNIKLRDIFSQLHVIGMTLHENKAPPSVKSDMVNSLIGTISIAVNIKPIDAMIFAHD